MLPRQHRLVNEKDFSKVYRSGKRASTKHLNIIYLASTGQDVSRFGFIVSKKEANRVTRRNLLKRRLRQATRELLPELELGFDVVVKAKKPALEQNEDLLKQELEQVFKKTGLIKK